MCAATVCVCMSDERSEYLGCAFVCVFVRVRLCMFVCEREGRREMGTTGLIVNQLASATETC